MASKSIAAFVCCSRVERVNGDISKNEVILYCEVIVVVVDSPYLPLPLPADNLEPIIRTHSDSSLQPESSYRLIPTTIKYYMHLHLQYSTVSNLHCRKLNSRLIPLRLHVLPVK